MKYTLFGIIFIFITLSEIKADKVKFTELTQEKFNTDRCIFYPDAKAIVLEKLGNIDFVTETSTTLLGTMNEKDYVSSKVNYLYRYGEGVRIKILDAEKTGLGNIKIQLYSKGNRKKGNGNQEEIYDITGCTYNLKDGKIVKEELKKSNIYTQRLNENWIEVSFVLPNVKKGSVIEYSYVKTSPYIEHLESWYFQSDLPILYNELTYTVPEYFNFQARVLGNMYEIRRDVQSTSVYLANESVACQRVRIEANDIPPVEEEPFVSNPRDLPMHMEFQLVAINFPNGSPKQIAGTYERFNKQLLDNDRFWKRVKQDGLSKEFKVDGLNTSDQEKAANLFEQLKEKITWNKNGGYFSAKTLKSCLADKSGSIADINLGLTALFRANGLEAYPVILSTRGHGAIHPVYPSYADFNYVISAVNIDGKFIFCDATARVPMGLLPLRCLNGNGWLVSENGGALVPLKGNGIDVSNAISTIQLKDGNIEATVDLINKEYAALHIIEAYERQGAQKYQEAMREKFTEWEFSDYKFQTERNTVSQSFMLKKPYESTDIIYIQPFLYGMPSEPLFKRDTRQAAIDFPYGIQQRVATTVLIPEGYEVEQLPEEISRTLSSKGASFTFEAFKGNGDVTFSVALVMRKTNYTPQEYPELKEFFEQFANLSKMMLVLKKR